MPNYFESLTIQSSNGESEKRIRYSLDEIRAFITASLKKNDECRMLIIVLPLTEARLTEIVCPHIEVELIGNGTWLIFGFIHATG